MNTEHSPIRPFWECVACGDPWPCLSAQEQLRAELSPTQLAIKNWAILEDAVFDLPAMPAKEAFDRFIRWTWPEHEVQPPPE